jgi:uncharacterized membrane protein SirB2
VYETLKCVHVAAVVASGTGFLARAALMLAGSPRLQARFVRVAPHVVDTLLLAAAVAMAVMARISPLAQPWLAAKIVGLLAYIVLGAIALRYGRTLRARVAALAGAVLAFAYIVGTALQRSPLWPLSVGS